MLAFDIDFFVFIAYNVIYICMMCVRVISFSLPFPNFLLHFLFFWVFSHSFFSSSMLYVLFFSAINTQFRLSKWWCENISLSCWCLPALPSPPPSKFTENIYIYIRDKIDWWAKRKDDRTGDKQRTNCIWFTFEYNIWCISNAFFTSVSFVCFFFVKSGAGNLCTQLFTMKKCIGFVIYLGKSFDYVCVCLWCWFLCWNFLFCRISLCCCYSM